MDSSEFVLYGILMKDNSRRCVKIPTANRLANVALHYLSRYAASEKSLRKVLENRIRLAKQKDVPFRDDEALQKSLHIAIETIIDKHKKTGVINDANFAETKAHSLRRAGKSRRVIEQKLGLKGVSKALIDKALSETDENESSPADADLKAAHRLAKRRRLGPHREGGTDEARHKKDMVAMARAGFSFDIIRKVLGGKCDDLINEDL